MKRYKLTVETVPVISPVEFTPATAQDRAACLALKAKGKLAKPKQRKDKWIDPALRVETAEKITRYVIRRIEFPRHGEPFPLSPTDRNDALQAGLTACVESGFFRHGIASLKVLKSIRNSIQGKACLRMRCMREKPCDDMETLADEIGFAPSEEIFTSRLRKSQVDMTREVFRVLRASRDADKTRKKPAKFKFHRDFFLLVLGFLTGKNPRVCTPNTFDKRAERFKTYLARGADFLRQTRKPANLAKEIMLALEMRGKSAMQS